MVTNTSEPRGQELTMSATATGLPFIVGVFFAFRLFIMLLSVRLLGTDNQTGVEISLGLGFLLLSLVLFQSLGVARHETASMLSLPSVRWVAIFLTFSGCSLAWTAAASLPAVFPSCSEVWVRSSTSSTIWNARPTDCP